MYHIEIGEHSDKTIIFAHGWGRSHRDFIPVAESLALNSKSILIDFPGFGESQKPEDDWGTTDYADYIADHIRKHIKRKILWVGHSFGGRVGLQLAVRHPDVLIGMVLVASAGIPKEKSFADYCANWVSAKKFRVLKYFAKNEVELDKLEQRFGSHDYIDSKKNGMRNIFLKVISEDQTNQLSKITVPTTLIYGKEDKETPPDIGEKLTKLIPSSQLVICEEFDHITILDRGRHVIALCAKEILKEEAR